MTRDNKQNLERKLDHLVDLTESLIEQYRHITCSERAAMLLTITADAKQVMQNVGIVRETLLCHLIDEFGVDYVDYARKIEGLQKRMLEELAGAPMVANLDTMVLPIIGAQQIMEHERARYRMNEIVGMSRAEYMLTYLIDSSTKMFDNIMESLSLIASDLRGIEDEDYYAMIDGKIDLDGIYEKLRRQYLEINEKEERESIEYILSGVLSVRGCTRQAMKRYMEEKRKEYDELTMAWIEGDSVAKIILQNRKRFTLKHLKQHFYNQLEWIIMKEKAVKIQKAEEAGILPTDNPLGMVVIGTNVEQQNNHYYINGRETQ